MPVPVSAMSVAMLAAVFQLPSMPVTQSVDDAWRIVERSQVGDVVFVNGVRPASDLSACLQQARDEGARLALGDSVTSSTVGLTQLAFPSSGVSFSCAQLVSTGATSVVNGPEAVLRDAGYRFGWE